jgi:hypothetical protein
MKIQINSAAVSAAARKIIALLNPKSIFMLWLAGFLVAGILLTVLTGGVRANAKIKTANDILERGGEARRIKAPISEWVMPGRAMQAGNWFELSDNNLALIFTVPVDGIFAPFLAVFNAEYTIDKIYPLSKTADYCVRKTNSAFLDVWSVRITDAAHILNRAQ